MGPRNTAEGLSQAMAQESFDEQAFLEQHGIESLADMQIEAHGGVSTVSQALKECPPFARMVTGLAASLKAVPDKAEILKNTIQAMKSPDTSYVSSEAKKKLKN